MKTQSQLINAKLRAILNENITSEQQVVYIFSKIRKLLEVNNLKGQYIVLALYCDWVLHGELSYDKTKRYFKGKFETMYDNEPNTKDMGENILISQHNFFVLNELRSQLSVFLEKESLPKIIVIRPNWTKFTELLLEILMECPVIIDGDKITDLSLVRDKGGEYIYRFHLKSKLKDGKNVIKIKLKLF